MPKILDLDSLPEPDQPTTKRRGRRVANSNGLTSPQVRVLQFLTHGKWVDRDVIREGAGIHFTWMPYVLGRVGDKPSTYDQQTGKPPLLTLGYVEERTLEIEEGIFERSYRITKSGRAAIGNPTASTK